MSTAKFDTLSTLDGSQSVPVGTVAQGSAKAWVNFNGTGTVAIRASFNVTSITDNGTGDYTLNFTTAMPDANYSVVGLTTGFSTINTTRTVVLKGSDAGGATSKTTTSVNIQTGSTALATLTDMADISISVFR
jgi:hypothetical protein